MGFKNVNDGVDFGQFKDIGKDTVSALKKTVDSNNQIDSSEIADIEKATKSDGKFTNGEKLLVSYLKEHTGENQVIQNLDFLDTPEITVKIESQKEPDTTSEDLKNIKDSTKSYKSAINFTAKFFRLKPEDQKLVSDTLSNILAVPHRDEINKAIANLPTDAKEAISELGINNTKNDSELAGLLSQKSMKLLPAFTKESQNLSWPEKDVALKVMKNLGNENPGPMDKKNIKTAMESLPRERSMSVGKILNNFNVFIPATNELAPTTEDATSRIKVVHMGNYTSPEIQGDYIRGVLKVAKKENFTIVLQSSKQNTPEQIKDWLREDLTSIEGLSKSQVDDLIKNHLKIVTGSRDGYEWAEDNKFITNNGEIKTFPKLDLDSSNSAIPINKTLAFTTGVSLTPKAKLFTKEGFHAAGLDNNDPRKVVDEHSIQGAVASREENLGAKELAKNLGKKVTTTRTYNEGGNMLLGALPNGEAYAVIGRDGLLISTFHLEGEHAKDKKKVPEFDLANVTAKVKEMEKGGEFYPDLINDTVKKLKSANEIPPGANPEKRAKEFLAKVEMVKDIFPKDIGVSKKNILYIPQPDFHVDMHLRPLAPGKLMINDFEESIKLLNNAKTKTEKGSWHEKEIDSMIEHTEKSRKVMEPVMRQIETNLKNSGLEVVRTPGVMQGKIEKIDMAKSLSTFDTLSYYYPDSASKFQGKEVSREEVQKIIENDTKVLSGVSNLSLESKNEISRVMDQVFTRHVNFMNAVPGTTLGSNRQYYMTNFSSIKPIRDAFEEKMHGYGIDKVYWIGNSGGSKNSLSGSESSLNNMGGMDCRENHEVH